ncbi:MAG: hypothetical protein KHW95_04835 [Firmicutes bacterium]|nr:hypothetical protein [Bacillota bacterium]
MYRSVLPLLLTAVLLLSGCTAGQKNMPGHTSKMFFEVNQAVNFRVIIGGNHIEICRKSFKESRCERLVRIK